MVRMMIIITDYHHSALPLGTPQVKVLQCCGTSDSADCQWQSTKSQPASDTAEDAGTGTTWEDVGVLIAG